MRTHISLIPVLALLAAGACAPTGETDPRLTQITMGIRRDSLLRILGASEADSLANIYRREMYLIGGSPMEILFYSPQGLKEGQGAAAAESTLRPVILTNNQVMGWGWAFFDSVARVNDIRVRAR
jgi:hypothetical protein